MKTLFPHINHQADPWHFIKNIKKRLFTASKSLSGRIIGLWLQSVTNQLWWAMGSSIGNVQLCREKMLSMFGHITGCHDFPSHEVFKKCEHPVLPEDRDKEYFKEGSPALAKVREAVMGQHGNNFDDLVRLDGIIFRIFYLNEFMFSFSLSSHW